jgi:hypothetical protein
MPFGNGLNALSGPPPIDQPQAETKCRAQALDFRSSPRSGSSKFEVSVEKVARKVHTRNSHKKRIVGVCEVNENDKVFSVTHCCRPNIARVK